MVTSAVPSGGRDDRAEAFRRGGSDLVADTGQGAADQLVDRWGGPHDAGPQKEGGIGLPGGLWRELAPDNERGSAVRGRANRVARTLAACVHVVDAHEHRVVGRPG